MLKSSPGGKQARHVSSPAQIEQSQICSKQGIQKPFASGTESGSEQEKVSKGIETN